ncbi:hypothetical protein K438DRAFT_1980903 [Mycena galopus ATCC 62051]|nr:hypothetical protein K438DRAFT_1980903 [Mycena galopus ATCC 62051]
MIQGGDFTRDNGTGGKSIYGERFAAYENFTHRHMRPGLLSMANTGPNTNRSQFFITTVPMPQLEGMHVVFSEVLEGMHVVGAIERQGSTSHGTPRQSVTIAASGIVESDRASSPTSPPGLTIVHWSLLRFPSRVPPRLRLSVTLPTIHCMQPAPDSTSTTNPNARRLASDYLHAPAVRQRSTIITDAPPMCSPARDEIHRQRHGHDDADVHLCAACTRAPTQVFAPRTKLTAEEECYGDGTHDAEVCGADPDGAAAVQEKPTLSMWGKYSTSPFSRLRQSTTTCYPLSLPDPHLDGMHVVFGEVLEGIDVVAAIERQGSAPAGTTSSPSPSSRVVSLSRRAACVWRTPGMAGKRNSVSDSTNPTSGESQTSFNGK